jgi:hypothetical protein
MREVYLKLKAIWARIGPKFRTAAVFIGGAGASAIIGAVFLGVPDWLSTARDRNAISGKLNEMTNLNSFINTQAAIYRRAWQRDASFESESERKGLFFTVDVACDGLRDRARAILSYESRLEERELTKLKSIAERIYSRSVCPKVRSPIYYVIEGTENNWRLFVAPPDDTKRLPSDVRKSIEQFRNECTVAQGTYADRACRVDEYATVAR